jgi:hypothetical protein
MEDIFRVDGARVEKARCMRANGHPVPVICQYTGLSVKEVIIALHDADMLDDNLIALYGKRLYGS